MSIECLIMRPIGTTIYNYDGIKETIHNGILKWERNCPKCNKILLHKCKSSARQCYRQNRVCANCGSWNKGLTKETNTTLNALGKAHSEWLKTFRKTNPPWNKGLTKESNNIIYKNSIDHLGYKHSDISKNKISLRSKDLWNDPVYRKKIISKVTEIKRNPEHILQWRLKMEQNGWFTPLQLKTEFERYKREVWNVTRKQALINLHDYNKRGRKNYHLDHKYSVTQGFLNNIPPEIIGNIINLEMLDHKKNITKNSKCSITKEQLLELYYADCKNKI